MNKLQCPVVEVYRERKGEGEGDLEVLWRAYAEEYRHKNNLSLDQALIELATSPKCSLFVRSFYAKLATKVKY